MQLSNRGNCCVFCLLLEALKTKYGVGQYDEAGFCVSDCWATPVESLKATVVFGISKAKLHALASLCKLFLYVGVRHFLSLSIQELLAVKSLDHSTFRLRAQTLCCDRAIAAVHNIATITVFHDHLIAVTILLFSTQVP